MNYSRLTVSSTESSYRNANIYQDILLSYKARCGHGRELEISCTEALVGLSTGATELTAIVGKGKEGNGPGGSLAQQTYFVKSYGSNEDVMEVQKQTGKDIKLLQEVLECCHLLLQSMPIKLCHLLIQFCIRGRLMLE